MNNAINASGMLTRKEAAAYLSISKSTLDKLDIPRIPISTRLVVYQKADIDAWLEAQKNSGRATA